MKKKVGRPKATDPTRSRTVSLKDSENKALKKKYVTLTKAIKTLLILSAVLFLISCQKFNEYSETWQIHYGHDTARINQSFCDWTNYADTTLYWQEKPETSLQSTLQVHWVSAVRFSDSLYVRTYFKYVKQVTP